jgi:hypothetical protein
MMTNDERHTTKDERRTTNDERPTHLARRTWVVGGRWSVVGGRWSFVIALAGLALSLLTACATTPGSSAAQAPTGGGSLSPEAVAQSFFEDLGAALADQKLADEQQRGAWAERLAGYFAPNERDDQRIALRAALDSFATGQDELEPNEDLTFELKIERLEQVEQTGDHAMIRPVNGAIYVLITRTTSFGTQNLYEETVPLEKIIGNNGSVPVIRIGRSWYLTEG